MKMSKTPLKNQKGFLILDFIFAIVLFAVFATIIFSFAITFSVVETLQYVSFASARSYFLSHQSETRQQDRAKEKFEQLANDGRLRSMITAGWFSIGDPEIGDFNEQLASDDDRGQDAANFNGVRIPFNAPILYKRFPIIGTTASGPDAFFAYIQSFGGREPTFQECQQFTADRINGVANFYGATNPGAYLSQYDNGC